MDVIYLYLLLLITIDKMNAKFWFVVFLIIPNVLFGQNYFDYYKEINKGKVLIASQNTEESINCYFSVFEKFDFVFARDCYNAIELSALAKDSVKLEYFIRRGIKQGLKFSQIIEVKNVSKFQNSTFLKEIEKEKDSLENAYRNSINWELRNLIIEMFKEDQAIREKYYNAILFKRKKIGHEWEALNKIQVKQILEITKEYGFPGEKIIGVDTDEMHAKINNSNISAGMPIVLFIHHFSQPNESYDSLLFEQIEKGNLYNEHFATICDFEATFGKKIYPNYGFFAFKKMPKIIEEEEINRKRKEISLLSISEFEKLRSNKLITKFWYRLY